MEKRVLGRGLGALIPDRAMDRKEQINDDASSLLKAGKGHAVVNLALSKIRANKYQPREDFNTELLKDLAASIKEKGFIQPVIVRAQGEEYELIAGERRLRAAQMLKLEEVPAIIKNVSDVDALEMAIIENIQREDLNPIDQAKAYKRLIDEFNMTQEKVSETIGKDRATVANILRLLNLPQKIREYVSRGTISMGHAKAILGLSKESDQMRLCTKTIKNDLSVRDTERYAKKINSSTSKKPKEQDHNLISVEEQLRDTLGTKVRIIKGKKGGRIEIEFYSDSDLERVIKLLK
ncbi:MAG: ParB/RepB/Spo0J family partition protein [Candidatus Omnitrophica bacterium]|nr:ParB/RepB/Spo0J family partition protein [Candidatus Omnitrophota bacterium]